MFLKLDYGNYSIIKNIIESVNNSIAFDNFVILSKKNPAQQHKL